MAKLIRIRNRDHLLSTLAEAAELEHNLMCLYLYAVFSLKQSTSEDLSDEELEAVARWRKQILDASVQEMGHLALVSNLIKAVGGSPHFFRSSFPISPGYFPSDFVIELAPFNQETLDHFIFLERPEEEDLSESAAFTPEEEYSRASPRHRLMTHIGDYETVGQLYRAIEEGIQTLCQTLGEEALFCGASALQLTPDDVKLEGLSPITDQASALKALHFIVEQGEGARKSQDSHFEKFSLIKTEYEELLRKNPNFKPGRPALRNPAMRKPVSAADVRTWIDAKPAVQILDLGNAIYALMLRFLTQVYAMEGRSAKAKQVLLKTAFGLMHSLGKAGSLLTLLPAQKDASIGNAGLSFALERHFSALELKNETALLQERLDELIEACEELLTEQALHAYNDPMQGLSQALKTVRKNFF